MVYLIAEVGVNHRGDYNLALEHLRAAKKAGADAVKFQAFRATELASADYAKDQLDFFAEVELTFPELGKLYEEAQKLEIVFLGTPFDTEAVDFLNELPVPAFKVSSGDLTNHLLLSYIARTQKPIYLSTGMSNIGEIVDAIGVCRRNGNQDITVLHCVSLYPTPPEQANLLAIRTLKEALDLPVGYSDHTVGIEACLAAVALGATVIEKHFVLDRSRKGPDVELSATPEEFTELRSGIDRIYEELGDGNKIPRPGEIEVAQIARRSLFTAHDVKKGEVLTPDLLTCHRPGSGIPASQYTEIVGHRVIRDVPAGEMLLWDMLEGV
ncbi:N-acetylneuraminate synthase family protein [bacterium]|nr:N-acetylneuraminate synthase family protein [bacterium]